MESSAFHIGDARLSFFLTSASKFNIEPNGGIFDVSSENDRASLNMKTPSLTFCWKASKGTPFKTEADPVDAQASVACAPKGTLLQHCDVTFQFAADVVS